MDISIRLLSDKPVFIYKFTIKGEKYENAVYEGEIQIGDFKETFEIPTNYWTLEDYKRQWKEGLERIKTHDTSCLVAIVQHPTLVQPLINWWVLYKEENKIFVQNELFVSDTYKEFIGENIFTPDNCYQYITPRDTSVYIDEEFGELKTSEWSVDFEPSEK